ncbi:MAG: FtsH protease activity modulator HflK [Rhizobiaceae bacterium]|nr:FtsH protease activity modulator HflK [Rhizobiaceae bacterium]
MPWSNQSGGGGGPWGGGGNNGNNGGGGGPWGNGGGNRPPNGGGGGGGQQPPDLEDIIRKGQDQLRKAMPGGGGLNPLTIGIGTVVLIGLYLTQAFYTIQEDELGVELRFGKPKQEVSTAGLHFHLWPIETYEVANTAENQINIGSTGRTSNTAGMMLSGDQNIVDVAFSVLYQVTSPNDYLFNVKEPEGMVRQVAESAMREVVGKRPAQDIFRDDRAGIADEVRQITQTTLDSYGAGLNINAVNIEDVAPPPGEVADAFDEVQRAEQNEDQFIEEANQYSNRILGAARGEAAQILEDAAAYKNRVVEEAKGEAQRFISVYDEYAKAPDVTRKRLFLETMEKVLGDSNKVIVEQGNGQGVVPYLPLPEINNRARQNQGAQ